MHFLKRNRWTDIFNCHRNHVHNDDFILLLRYLENLFYFQICRHYIKVYGWSSHWHSTAILFLYFFFMHLVSHKTYFLNFFVLSFVFATWGTHLKHKRLTKGKETECFLRVFLYETFFKFYLLFNDYSISKLSFKILICFLFRFRC